MRENFKVNLIANLDFAREVCDKQRGSSVVSVEPDVVDTHSPRDGLVGYDVIDERCSVSLITNWGTTGKYSTLIFNPMYQPEDSRLR